MRAAWYKVSQYWEAPGWREGRGSRGPELYGKVLIMQSRRCKNINKDDVIMTVDTMTTVRGGTLCWHHTNKLATHRLVVKASVHSLFSNLSGSLPHNCSMSTTSRMDELPFIKGRCPSPLASSGSSSSMLVERFFPIWNSYSSNQAKMFNLFQDTKNSSWKVFLNQFGVLKVRIYV